MTDTNGRWKLSPNLALTLAGIIFHLGVQVAGLWYLKVRVDDLTLMVSHNVRSRAEGDEIIKRFDLMISANTAMLADHEQRLRVVEGGKKSSLP